MPTLSLKRQLERMRLRKVLEQNGFEKIEGVTEVVR